ncbi:hypothetical protein LTR10_020969 [Elasticomyces elasticus]|uniref:Myb-like domain-containing protein n=1 Tax=Exophiala sideris TaxID=1016849 RepID=A0ABR0J9M2_9EURO|nr:hypothetical protein LTR10_020969 [Elasticomyces elasticus]KAK5027935.1 hypothetical protein LTS07_006811 [Exophiala sideris]KAK5037474.1 hypothetical protein LTR13_004631 [Exophiala sideris]KAK5059135.1 hypothetical protein LTR69_006424 [Exophiala sideris]KAK5182969.1 hypothetical protein LTR44_004679 [Eurotiomycetes sp. CCFEE 6388]
MSSATNMAANMTPSMAAWPPPPQQPTMGWPEQHLPDPHMQYTQQTMMPTYMQPVRPQSMPNIHNPQESGPRPGQSGPWTPEEDETLIKAKGEGLAWDEIHRRYFPHKTGNACRKRHDRLLIKARDPTWDEARTQKVIGRYNRVREQVWRPIADSVGEKWEDVERVVLQQGCRGLRTRPQHGRTKSRASSGQGGLSGEWDHISSSTEERENTDDSGISLGHAGHSRRASEIGTGQPQSLPKVQYLLSEADMHYPYTSYNGGEGQ